MTITELLLIASNTITLALLIIRRKQREELIQQLRGLRRINKWKSEMIKSLKKKELI